MRVGDGNGVRVAVGNGVRVAVGKGVGVAMEKGVGALDAWRVARGGARGPTSSLAMQISSRVAESTFVIVTALSTPVKPGVDR